MILINQIKTTFGPAWVAVKGNDLLALFLGADSALELRDYLGRKYNRDEIKEGPQIDYKRISSCTLKPAGTEFQMAVWQVLKKIKPGKTLTYEEVASLAGRPAAIRAAASAVGANPISLFIPCHRVLRKSGDLGGYRWGIDLKKEILKSEGVKV
jgi:O-6-methylguanine DNA methyltransferase